MSPREAIEKYIAALDDLGIPRGQHQFRVENNRIAIGHVFGPEIDDVQWSMRWHTPEEFAKMAEMRRLDLPSGGDPKKPWR